MYKMEKKLKQLKKLKVLHTAIEGLNILRKISNLQKRQKRSCSVRKINRDRKKNGFFAVSFEAMKSLNSGEFFLYTRMTARIFDLLLNLIKPYLIKTSIRTPIQPECRLAVVLQYLAQGTSLQSLAQSFKLGKETVRIIVLETCEILWKTLFPVYVKEPNENDYTQMAEDFWRIWSMPNCIGCVGGKHIAIRHPPRRESQLFCDEKFYGVVLLAACDARYRFTFVDIGAYGSQGDEDIFQASRFGKRLLHNNLPIPPPKHMPGTDVKVPHHFIADTGFPLGKNIMRPYPGKLLRADKANFNKRTSRALRTIENSFGILVARWRVLLNDLHLYPENAEKVVLACVALHNFIMFNKEDESSYCPANYTDWEDDDGIHRDGLWRNEVQRNLPSITASSIHYSSDKASVQIRNEICKFLNDK